jgi:hypothetical protein
MVKIGDVIWWKTKTGEYHKGEVTGLQADTVTVTKTEPYVAYGVMVIRLDIL